MYIRNLKINLRINAVNDEIDDYTKGTIKNIFHIFINWSNKQGVSSTSELVAKRMIFSVTRSNCSDSRRRPSGSWLRRSFFMRASPSIDDAERCHH